MKYYIYAYDLALWSTIGAKRNLATQASVRLLMKSHPMSPIYWHELLWALTDMVRQCGYPRIFQTFAPYEDSFPYHAFIEDMLGGLLRDRVKLPLEETLHMTHVLTQLAMAFLAGQHDAWERRVFNVKDANGKKVRLAIMMHIEL